MTCRGVGTGSQSTDWDVRHYISLGNGRIDTYTAPELPDSKTPALLGRISMARLRMLLDCFTGVAYMVGPGGYELKLSPGSEKHDLESSSMGHMMLPCSKFNGTRGGTKEALSFVVGEYYAAAPSGTPRGVAHLENPSSTPRGVARLDPARTEYFDMAAGDASDWEDCAEDDLPWS